MQLLGEDYQVLKALSAGSLMLLFGLVCFGQACSFVDSSPSMHQSGCRRQGHDAASLQSVFGPYYDHTGHCTRTTPVTNKLSRDSCQASFLIKGMVYLPLPPRRNATEELFNGIGAI